MIVSIHQPNFLPWVGYFVKIIRSDLFVMLDNVQFTKGGFCNRVKVKGKNGLETWLTVPVKLAEGTFKNINELHIDYSKNWIIDIGNRLNDYYHKAPFKNKVLPFLFETLNEKTYHSLAQLNGALILKVLDILRIERKIVWASSFGANSLTSNELLVDILQTVQANTYLSGTGAKKYMDETLYNRAGLNIRYNEFSLPEYRQVNGLDFVPNLSVIDILLNIGSDATREVLEQLK
jgi:hypothetical protein